MARWCAGGGCVSVCVRMSFHVCMQIDTFVLFVLQIRSQDHRHFGTEEQRTNMQERAQDEED